MVLITYEGFPHNTVLRKPNGPKKDDRKAVKHFPHNTVLRKPEPSTLPYLPLCSSFHTTLFYGNLHRPGQMHHHVRAFHTTLFYGNWVPLAARTTRPPTFHTTLFYGNPKVAVAEVAEGATNFPHNTVLRKLSVVTYDDTAQAIFPHNTVLRKPPRATPRARYPRLRLSTQHCSTETRPPVVGRSRW